MKPHASEVKTIYATPKAALYYVQSFDLNQVGNGFMVPTEGYNLGTIMVGESAGSTAVLTPRVSNDHTRSMVATHASGSVFSAVTAAGIGVTQKGLALDHAFFGVEVTTANGSAAVADVWISLKNTRP